MTQKHAPETSPAQAGFPIAQDILMDAPIGIFTSTPEGRYISVNPALSRMCGYDSPEELIESVTDIATQIYADPEDREELIRLLEEHGEVVHHECLFRRRDGSILWVSRTAHVVRDVNSSVISYHGFTTDITRSSTGIGSKKDIPLIALTAYAMLGDRERFLAAGMNNYLGKPVSVDDLEKVLETVQIGRRQGA